MNVDDLRRKLRERGLAVSRLATEILRQQVLAAAGPNVPEGVVTTTDSYPVANDILSQIRADPPLDAGTIWQWDVGSPACPFEPHQALAGAVFDMTDWRVALSKDLDEYPRGNRYWLPQDHVGCQCSVEIVLGSVIFDAVALDASPFTVRAFGQTVLVTPAAPGTTQEIPDWWLASVTPEAWSEAVREAERRL